MGSRGCPGETPCQARAEGSRGIHHRRRALDREAGSNKTRESWGDMPRWKHREAGNGKLMCCRTPTPGRSRGVVVAARWRRLGKQRAVLQGLVKGDMRNLRTPLGYLVGQRLHPGEGNSALGVRQRTPVMRRRARDLAAAHYVPMHARTPAGLRIPGSPHRHYGTRSMCPAARSLAPAALKWALCTPRAAVLGAAMRSWRMSAPTGVAQPRREEAGRVGG